MVTENILSKIIDLLILMRKYVMYGNIIGPSDKLIKLNDTMNNKKRNDVLEAVN